MARMFASCRPLLVVLLVGGFALGCSPRKPNPATTRPLGPPVFDGRRGGGSFPIETTTAITSTDQLLAALEAGYTKRLSPPSTPATRPTTNPSTTSPPPPATAVSITPLGNTDLRSLTVNVSGWRVRNNYQPSQFTKDAILERTIRAAEVVYSAEPLRYEKGELSVRLEARDAVLQVLREKSGQRGLILAGARDGELHFYAPMQQFQQVFTAGAKRGAGSAGIAVSSVTLELTSDNSRRLDGVITIKGSWLLLPLTIRVFGRMEVDDTMHANFTNLGATGTGPAGDLLAPFVDRAVRKIDGRRSPLMAFRDGKTKARDFAVHTGDAFDVRIKFGQ